MPDHYELTGECPVQVKYSGVGELMSFTIECVVEAQHFCEKFLTKTYRRQQTLMLLIPSSRKGQK